MRFLLLAAFSALMLADSAPAQTFECTETRRGESGQLTRSTVSRVIGGRPASMKKWTFIVSLQQSAGDGGYSHFCGGAMITDEWIITAAHCIKKPDILERVVLGADDLRDRQSVDRAQKRRVVRTETHPGYGNGPGDDIGLIQVEPPFDIAPREQARLFGNQRYIDAGACSEVGGWGWQTADVVDSSADAQEIVGALPRGTAYRSDELPDGRFLVKTGAGEELNEAAVPVVTNAVCQAGFDQNRLSETVTDKELCAGFRRGGIDSCNGDSGSPLMAHAGAAGWRIFGVVSRGARVCAEPGVYGVYTRTAPYVEWIRSVIE